MNVRVCVSAGMSFPNQQRALVALELLEPGRLVSMRAISDKASREDLSKG